MKAQKRTNEKGLALVGILLMLTILATVAVLLASLGSANQRLANTETDSDAALYTAEAGLAIALESYIQDPAYVGNATPQPFGQSGQSFRVSLYDETSPPPSGAIIPPDHILVVSRGYTQRGTTRSVSTLVTARKQTEGQDNALYAGERLSLISGGVAAINLPQSVQQAQQQVTQQQQALQQQSQQLQAQQQQGQLTLQQVLEQIQQQLLAQEQQSAQQWAAAIETTQEGLAAKEINPVLSLKTTEAPAPVMRVVASVEETSTSKSVVAAKSMAMTTSSTSSSMKATSSPDGTTSTESATGNSTAHVAVDSSGEGGISLGAGTAVEGELRVPSGADAGVVIDDQSGGNHSGVNDGYLPPTMVPVRPPLVPGDTDITWTSGSSPSGNSFTGNGQLKPGAYGDVVVDGGVLELNTADLENAADNGESPKDLYVFKSLTLRNGGKIVLKGNAESIDLTSGLYIDEKLEIVDGALENETNDPARLQVYVMEGAPVDIKYSDDSHHTLYAPGSTVNFTGGDLYGSVVGEEIILDNGTNVFYDEVLAGVNPDPWGNGGFYTERKSYRRN